MGKSQTPSAETAVATVTPTINGVALPGDLLGQMQQLAGAGMEEAGAKDYALPFLKLVQDISAERKKSEPAYIQGIDTGDIFNSVTREVYKQGVGVRIIPVHFSKTWLEFKPNRGGFVAAHDTKEDALANQQAGNDIVEVNNHYVLQERPDGSFTPAVLSMKMSQLKVSRAWNATIADVRIDNGKGQKSQAPSFARVYRLDSVNVSGQKGTYANYKIVADGWVSQQLFAEALAFRQSFLAGEVKTNYAETVDAVVETDDKPAF